MMALARDHNIIDFPQKQKSNEWYTPARYIEAAREVMGGIELDPASCEVANRTVKATRYFTEYFTEEENGLVQPWVARSIWLNPPYSRTNEMKAKHQSFIAMFVDKLLSHYTAGQVQEAILLASAQVDARWFRALWQFPICFVDHKIHFNLPVKRESYSFHMFGTCFVYLGLNEQKFAEVFSQFGRIAKAVDIPRQQVVTLSLWEGQS